MYLCRTDDGIELRAIRSADIQELLELAIWPEELWPLQCFRQRLVEATEMHARREALACAVYVNGGVVGYIILDFHGRKHGELHYGLVPSHRGKGTVTRGCAALIDYAFLHLDLESIKVILSVSNSKGCGVPERLGFEKVGTSWAQDEDGRPVQIADYVMTREAWQRRKG